MTYIETWDETKPAGSRDANLGDDDIREFKRAIRERLAGGGQYFPSTDDSDAGLYNYVKFIEQSDNPTAAADRGYLFTKEVDGVTELHWMDSGGSNFQITSGGEILLTALGSYTARGDLIRGGESDWERVALGTSGQVLRSDGTDAAWAAIQKGDYGADTLPDGTIVQIQYEQYAAKGYGNTALPDDSSVPQISEGDQYMTKAITPNAATNILMVDVITLTDNDTHAHVVTALFKDGATDAVAATRSEHASAGPAAATLKYFVVAGSTDEITFTVRCGATAGNTTFNGGDGNNVRFGTAVKSSITITEIAAS